MPSTPFPAITAASILVADLDSGHVIAERASATTLPIASLTKLMTTLVISEQINLTQRITITSRMLAPYGATPGLTAGLTYSFGQLLLPALEASSNDAAEAISCF